MATEGNLKTSKCATAQVNSIPKTEKCVLLHTPKIKGNWRLTEFKLKNPHCEIIEVSAGSNWSQIASKSGSYRHKFAILNSKADKSLYNAQPGYHVSTLHLCPSVNRPAKQVGTTVVIAAVVIISLFLIKKFQTNKPKPAEK